MMANWLPLLVDDAFGQAAVCTASLVGGFAYVGYLANHTTEAQQGWREGVAWARTRRMPRLPRPSLDTLGRLLPDGNGKHRAVNA